MMIREVDPLALPVRTFDYLDEYANVFHRLHATGPYHTFPVRSTEFKADKERRKNPLVCAVLGATNLTPSAEPPKLSAALPIIDQYTSKLQRTRSDFNELYVVPNNRQHLYPFSIGDELEVCQLSHLMYTYTIWFHVYAQHTSMSMKEEFKDYWGLLQSISSKNIEQAIYRRFGRYYTAYAGYDTPPIDNDSYLLTKVNGVSVIKFIYYNMYRREKQDDSLWLPLVFLSPGRYVSESGII